MSPLDLIPQLETSSSAVGRQIAFAILSKTASVEVGLGSPFGRTNRLVPFYAANVTKGALLFMLRPRRSIEIYDGAVTSPQRWRPTVALSSEGSARHANISGRRVDHASWSGRPNVIRRVSGDVYPFHTGVPLSLSASIHRRHQASDCDRLPLP